MFSEQLKVRAKQGLEWLEGRSARERWIILATLVVLAFMVWDALLHKPLLEQIARQQLQVDRKRGELEKIRQPQQAIMARARLDPDKDTRQTIAVLKKELAQLNKQLKDMTVDLIGPRKMTRVLEEVLTRQTDLTLTKIESPTREPLIEASGLAIPGGTPLPGVYKHTLVFEFQGSFLGTLEYLKALEELPWLFYWEGVHLDVIKYPMAHVTISVSALSLNEAWIGT